MPDVAPARPRPTLKHRVIRLLVILLVLYFIWLLAASGLERAMLFPRRMADFNPRGAAGEPDVQVVNMATDQGDVETWFIPGKGAAAHNPRPAVIFFHGNAETIDFLPDSLRPYTDMGVSVLLVEYRGYGRSAGTPSQAKLTIDAIAACDLLVARPDVDAARIVYHGRSLGAAVACQLAIHRPPAALVLQSPFKSVTSIAARYLVPRFLVRDPFDSAAVLSKLDRPVLIVHGAADTIVPVAQGRALADMARKATFIEYENAGHNDFPVDSPRHWRDITDFLTRNRILDRN